MARLEPDSSWVDPYRFEPTDTPAAFFVEENGEHVPITILVVWSEDDPLPNQWIFMKSSDVPTDGEMRGKEYITIFGPAILGVLGDIVRERIAKGLPVEGLPGPFPNPN